MFKTKFTNSMLEDLSNRQLETISAVQAANQLFEQMGLSNVSNFMTNLAMQESRLGKDVSNVSYSPFQIDPIRYQDLQEKASKGEGTTIDRASLANQLLQLDPKYNKNIDILNLSNDERRDPLIGALLTRMALATISEKIPTDLTGQANYWKKHWNSSKGKGKPEHFINQVQHYNNVLNTKTYDNTPLQDY